MIRLEVEGRKEKLNIKIQRSSEAIQLLKSKGPDWWKEYKKKNITWDVIIKYLVKKKKMLKK